MNPLVAASVVSRVEEIMHFISLNLPALEAAESSFADFIARVEALEAKAVPAVSAPVIAA